jgi:hypothetical protein
MFAKTNKNEIKIDFLLGTENSGEKTTPPLGWEKR